MKHWTFRQLAIAILLIAASTIAIKDPSTRDRFFEITAIALGGYLGQMNPQGSQAKQNEKTHQKVSQR